MRLQRIMISCFLLTIPLSAFAEQQWLFSLKKGENVVWKGFGQIVGQGRDDGVLLTTTGTGGFITSDFSFSSVPDSVTIVSSQGSNTDVLFVWMLENGISQAKEITLPAGEHQETIVNLASEPQWKKSMTSFGLQLSPQQEILLTSLTFSRTSELESLLNAARSFWNFDSYRSYAINFVWGPQFALGNVARAQLWDFLPPQAFSATRFANIALLMFFAIVILSLAFQTSLSTHVKKILFFRWSLIAIIVVWVMWDIRMGSEQLSWILHDARTYITQSAEHRTFRDRDRFYDFAEWAKQHIEDRESYVFFAERPWPYLGNMRYITYPSIPGNDTNDDTWVIYKRPEITVDAEGHLSAYGSPLSRPGTVLGKFERGSFVFRTNP